jgi:hypothetical protein
MAGTMFDAGLLVENEFRSQAVALVVQSFVDPIVGALISAISTVSNAKGVAMPQPYPNTVIPARRVCL